MLKYAEYGLGGEGLWRGEGRAVKGDIVDHGPPRVMEVAVVGKLECTAYVTHEGGMAKSKSFGVFALNEGNPITGDDVVACLQWAGC